MEEQKSNYGWIALAVIVAVIVGVAYYTSEAQRIKRWQAIGINCLPDNVDFDLMGRIPADISIRVDSEFERVPANIGVLRTCIAEMHTHDTDGVIHMVPEKQFTLGQLFDMMGKPIMRGGYQLLIAINGSGYIESEEGFRAMPIHDGDRILFDYQKLPVQ